MKANVVGWGWVVEERDGWNGNPELCWARLLPPSVSDPPLGQPRQSGGSVKSRDLHPQALRRGGPSSCALSPKGSDKAAAETATHASVEDTKPHIQGPPSIVCEGSVIRGGSDIVVMNVWRRSRMGVSRFGRGQRGSGPHAHTTRLSHVHPSTLATSPSHYPSNVQPDTISSWEAVERGEGRA